MSVNALNWRGCRNTDVENPTWSDLIYPRGDPDAVTVTLDDFLLLNPCEFISDTIIDFYIKYLQSRLPEEEKKRFHFFNSFFYRKLVKLDSDSGSEQTGSRFEHLRRWTRGIDIFEKDFLFIPIMQSAHWSLIIVCHPGELFKDGCQESCNCKRTLILHFDSMEGFHKGVGKLIEKYLMEHWKHKFSMPILKTNTFVGAKCIGAKVPQQTNFSDCGLFMLHYVEMFLNAFESKIPKVQVSRDWFNPEDAASKRSLIQRLIKQMQEEELEGRVMANHVEQLEEPSIVTVPMQDASVVGKVNASVFMIREIEGESLKKIDNPLQIVLSPDNAASQEEDVPPLDDACEQIPALSSGWHGKPCHPLYQAQDEDNRKFVEDSAREFASGVNMKVTHTKHLATDSDRRDVMTLFCEGCVPRETINKVHKRQCFKSSTSTALQSKVKGLGPMGIRNSKSESDSTKISRENFVEGSLISANVEFTHPHHRAESDDGHVIDIYEDIVSEETTNREHEKRDELSSTSKALHQKSTGMSNMWAATGDLCNLSMDFKDCDKDLFSKSRPRCLPPIGHVALLKVNDPKTFPDATSKSCCISTAVLDKAALLKSTADSREEVKPIKFHLVGANPRARVREVQVQHVSESLGPLYISSDEETGFAKVHKMVEASKVRLQNRQSASRSQSATGAAARNASEGTENQPPNVRWRLRRKSHLLLH